MIPQDQVYFYLQQEPIQTLRSDLSCQIAVIGGGFAGLAAAYTAAQAGKSVVLLEKNYCGSGASGKSSGFITPNSELSFSDFIRHFGPEAAQDIWNHISSGVNDIRHIIKKYDIHCDYVPQDTLVLANTDRDLDPLKQEYEHLKQSGYGSFFIEKADLSQRIAATRYHGALGYPDTFCITAFRFCSEFKKILRSMGVAVYEETPVISIQGNTIVTAHASVRADNIIVCTDRYTPEFTSLKQEVFQVQTFIMLSQELTNEEISSVFPNGPVMCWDTDTIYTYFRLSNRRFLIGGGTILSSYTCQEDHNNESIQKKLTEYVKSHFPQLKLTFEYMWPGLIGVSSDVSPLVGRDKNNKHVTYACAGTGLPISWAIGRYASHTITDKCDDLDRFFSPYRKPLLPFWMQSVIGKKYHFALNNAYTMLVK